jgi:DNA-3-methyladenine glycosylase II
MNKSLNEPVLNEETYHRGIHELITRNSDLAEVISRYGVPPFWTHSPGFSGIVLSILSQQVSLESADAAYAKLETKLGEITPEQFMLLDDDTLRDIGFSRQKASYVRGLAHAIVSGGFDLQALESMENEQVRNRLMDIRGIGAWTADTYLLFALRRADAWPSGDLALIKAIQGLRGLTTIPSSGEVDTIAQSWRPLRAVAARILWHHYLNERGRNASA